MRAIDLYLNLAYVAYVIAPAIKNELWLRVLLALNAVAFSIWGTLIGNMSVVFWNGLFTVISVFAIVRLLRERRIVILPPELESVRASLFPSVSNRDFLLFWSLGETERLATGSLTTEGQPVARLFLLVEGAASVLVDETEVARLGSHQFIGEMAFVTGQPASASVEVIDASSVHSWAFADLETLHSLEPRLIAPLLRTVNRDLAEKLRA
ncbi:MAG: cyclic nucleotide-binding domain-containing protein [Acidimicrobiia bacterium]|nr:cyclic nucleotide-binding domain-containing protein [Acidimicrobiia bacterium]